MVNKQYLSIKEEAMKWFDSLSTEAQEELFEELIVEQYLKQKGELK